MLYRNYDTGLLEVITSGSMFAGKTKTLLARLETFKFSGRNTVLYCFKGSQDRYDNNSEVVTHDGQKMQAHQVISSEEISNHFKNLISTTSKIDAIGIDEIMLFDRQIIDVVEGLVKDGFIVIVSGLSLTSDGKPFGVMPELLAMADIITKVYGVCQKCGNPSTRSWPLFDKKDEIVLGNQYTALCRRCWYEKKEDEFNEGN